MKKVSDPSYQVVASTSLTLEETVALGGGQPLENFAYFSNYSSAKTELFYAKVLQNGQLVAVAPVVRLVKRKSTDVLRPPFKKWLGLLFGPLAIKTTLLLDTSFLAYQDRSPFHFRTTASNSNFDPLAIKRAVADFLKAQKGVHTVWITEPANQSQWAEEENFTRFAILPMVHVSLEAVSSLEQYVSNLSKKARRNYRKERKKFMDVGAEIESVEGPLTEALASQLQLCLEASAKHSSLEVPYNDVAINPEAFQGQKQRLFIARLDGQVIGFMSFLSEGKKLFQCHGGLDYQQSHQVYAYHNLIYATLEYAILNGYQRYSMGPLNNETKRRLGQELMPMVACLWNRSPIDSLIAKKLYINNFEVRYEMDEHNS